jgi:hypothetical protein
MSSYRERKQKAEEIQPRIVIFGCIYIIVLTIVAFLLAGVVMDHVDLYRVFNLYGTEIPLVKIRGYDIPQWVLQMILTLIVILFLQPIIIIVVGLISWKRSDFDWPSQFRRW